MGTHEFAFGGVPCLVVTARHSAAIPSVARMYVIVNAGAALRVIVDAAGEPLEFRASQDVDSLGKAVEYLEKRFGNRGDPIIWTRPWWYLGRNILEDAPLREGESLT